MLGGGAQRDTGIGRPHHTKQRPMLQRRNFRNSPQASGLRRVSSRDARKNNNNTE